MRARDHERVFNKASHALANQLAAGQLSSTQGDALWAVTCMVVEIGKAYEALAKEQEEQDGH